MEEEEDSDDSVSSQFSDIPPLNKRLSCSSITSHRHLKPVIHKEFQKMLNASMQSNPMTLNASTNESSTDTPMSSTTQRTICVGKDDTDILLVLSKC